MPRPATSRALFGNDRPLELEIGSGKGTFLVAQSKLRPDVNFLGVEYARRYWSYASDRLRRNACENARLVLAEASGFIRSFIEDESLSAIHIYFPDPWPKTRHHKRRLIQPPVVALFASKLKPGSRLQIVTDHESYFEQIRDVLESSRLNVVSFEPQADSSEREIVGTNFERKYLKQGRPFYAIAAKRESSATSIQGALPGSDR